jgi:hypothetical protein
MTSLNNHQKELIFDYCIGQTTEQQRAQIEELISTNKEAAKVYSKIKAALAPLDVLEPQDCPDDLVERTILRLTEISDSAHEQLERLIAEEQSRKATIKIGFWNNIGEIAAIAAVVIFAIGVSIPTIGSVQHEYRKKRCQVHLGNIFQGINQYCSDHDGALPTVASSIGEPWWKVGYQGKENHSNTRSVWLLVRNNYVQPVNFTCPGRRQHKKLYFDTLNVQDYNDFPGRAYVHFSFRIRCRSANRGRLICDKILMADSNPLSERLPQDYSKSLKLRIDDKLLTLNSINHRRRGQNVLFGDGSIKFVRTRNAGVSNDDIFTLQGMHRGAEVNGCETPSCETDAFVAP